MRCHLFAPLAALLAGLAAPAPAQSFEQNAALCTGQGSSSLDLRIGACTALIQGGQLARSSQPDAFYNRGRYLHQQGEFRRAIADFDQAILLNPQFSQAHGARGLAHYRLGDHDRAIADQSQAIRIDPGYGIAYYNRGLAYEQTGDDARALPDFRQALRLIPAGSETRRSICSSLPESKLAAEEVGRTC